MNNNFQDVKKILVQRTEEVARYLLPRGKKVGNEWCVGSVDGEAGDSLKVHLTGEKSGVWQDFATGDVGDIIDLWSAVRKISRYSTLREAQQYLGITQPKFEGYKQKKFTKPDPNKVKEAKSSSPVMAYLIGERKLTNETIRIFRIGEKNREIVFNYYRENELIFRKYLSLDRDNGKKKTYAEKDCEPCLFGWDLISPNSRSIRICEGEIDAMTLYQYGLPTLSVPFGGGNGKKQAWIEYEYDRLSVYDEIFLCFDPDTSGNEAVNEIISRLGRHRCRLVTLPYKDANECLQKGIKKEEIHQCFDDARTLEPEELKPASAFVDAVINEFYPKEDTTLGYELPWQYAKNKILLRPDELSIWTGINGHGKSQALGHIILQAMKDGAKVCVASLEIKPKKLLMRLTRQASALAEPTEDFIRAIHEWYEDKLWLFDLVGTAKTDRLLDVFLYARQRYGVDVFVIDSFMKCGIDEDDYKAQKIFIEQICDFKNQYNCHVHIVVHPRKGADESQIIGKLDCKGTGAITDLADNCFTVWRNKKKEEIVQIQLTGKTLNIDQSEKLKECDCILRCDKQRNGEWEGKIALWFDKSSFQYLANPNYKAIPFVDFSKTTTVF